jgi:phosphohistidine phosphatase SixA
MYLRRHIPISLAVAISIAAAFPGSAADVPNGKTLVADLRSGGYVLYMRHPKTDTTQADTDTLHLENCAAQRALLPEGRETAKAIGEAFRALKIGVGKLMSSHYCRALEAAKLTGLGPVEASLDISEPQNVPPVEGQRRAAALKQLLATTPPKGTNALLVAHRPNLQDAAGKEFGDLGEGEIAVFKPLGSEGFRLVARVPPTSWPRWAKELAP